MIEYVCMELLGNFIIGPMLFPMHLSTIALSYAYVGIGAGEQTLFLKKRLVC